ncbi:MAG: hypothetical protein ACRD3J_01075, partial [Thermoanaerobaculia bacterium]
MTRRILVFTLMVLVWWAPRADAACTGSGLAWNCSAGTTSAQLASALGSATDGATLTFAAGTYSWSSFVSFSNTKGATLICASAGACDVSVSGTVLGMNGTLSGTNNKLYRISGFDFSGGGAFVIWFYGQGTMTKVRIDHNSFSGQSSGNTLIFFGENATVANFYGLVDHNTVTNSSTVAMMQTIGAKNSAPPPSQFGTVNNLFVEDNTITIGTMTNPGLGCVDTWGGAAVVWRFNTTTNCLVTTHGATHAGGPSNIELYNNKIIMNAGADASFRDCYRCFHHQGSGEFIAFNNR